MLLIITRLKPLFLVVMLLSLVFIGCDLSYLTYDPFGVKSSAIDWKIIETSHFRYHYQDNPVDQDWRRVLKNFDGSYTETSLLNIEQAAQAYALHFEQWYVRLKELFQTDPASTKKIDVFNYIDYEQKNHVTGGYANQFIDYATPSGDSLAIHLGQEGVCAHELVHIFQTTIGNAPALLMEGLAVAGAGSHWENIGTQESPIWAYVDLPTLTIPNFDESMLQTPRWWNYHLHLLAGAVTNIKPNATILGALSRQVDQTMRPHDLIYWGNNLFSSWYVYAIGGSFIHFLVNEYGWEKFIALYGSVTSSTLIGPDFLATFQHIYGKGFMVIEEEWEDYLENYEISGGSP